jgi:hypothetical protein
MEWAEHPKVAVAAGFAIRTSVTPAEAGVQPTREIRTCLCLGHRPLRSMSGLGTPNAIYRVWEPFLPIRLRSGQALRRNDTDYD